MSILLADIGGTNSRFALAGPAGRPEQIVIVENDSAADLAGAIARYLADTGARPHAAVLAIAAPVDDDRDDIALTNRPAWRVRRADLAQRFGLSQLRVVNDFEAIAWAVPHLDPGDARALGEPTRPGAGVKAVLGPGTGLGVAALVPLKHGRWRVLATEGGHAAFGPQAPDEAEVFARLYRTHGFVSAETILSGPGLVRLMHAVEPQSPQQTPEAVVTRALIGDPAALTVTRLFVRLLGRFAGSLALTFKALGGVYIAGGVASRLGTLIDAQAFRIAFEAHPPHQGLLRGIPTLLMSRSEPGLLGCAALAQEMMLR